MIPDDMKLLGQSVRFGLVGVVNSLLGGVAIFGLTWLGATPGVANALGYAAGLTTSFVLHRHWTFADPVAPMRQLPRYLAVVAAGYIMNLAAVLALTADQGANAYAAQFVGMCIYACSTFAGLRMFVFGRPGGTPTQ